MDSRFGLCAVTRLRLEKFPSLGELKAILRVEREIIFMKFLNKLFAEMLPAP